MKNRARSLLILVFPVLMTGCSSAPQLEPGTGVVANYTPFVDMSGIDPIGFKRDLAFCRGTGDAAISRKEHAVDICMTGRGYVTLDHAPVSHAISAGSATPLPQPSRQGPIGVVSGRDLVQAEKYAKTHGCDGLKPAELTSKGPGFETYRMACADMAPMDIRCEFGNCLRSESRIAGDSP